MGWISDRHMKSGGSLNRNPRNNGSDRGPLRKVIERSHGRLPDESKHLIYETLECGHRQRPRSDIMGEYPAERRRCRKCKAGKPADVKPETE